MRRCVFVVVGLLLICGTAFSQEVQKLLPSDGAERDTFGWIAADMVGDTLVIGVSLADVVGSNSGAVYVFNRSAGVWAEHSKLVPSDGAERDRFGVSVAIEGETLVIGAQGDDDNGEDSGSAYIFTRSAGIWTQQAKLQPLDGDEDDLFGHWIALAGDTLVITAPGDDVFGDNSGSAYVFTRSNGIWTEQAKLQPSDGAMLDQFGSTLGAAVEGDTVAVGASQDDVFGEDSGSVYVFTRSDGVWTEQVKLVPSVGDGVRWFGSDLALDGDTLLIGSTGDDVVGELSGSVYVFTRSNGVWTQQARLVPSDAAEGDEFGGPFALAGDTLVIGAFRDDVFGEDSGSAYVFTRTNGVWTEQEKLIPSDGNAGDWFGLSVTMAGGTVVIGSPADDDNGDRSGSAYVFEVAQSAPDLLNSLGSLVLSMNMKNGTENSFDSKLNAALRALDDLNENNDVAAVNTLGAFINAVEAQRGNELTDEQADALIAAAQQIIDQLLNGG